MDVLRDDRPKVGGGHVRHVEAADLPAALHQGHDGLLLGRRLVSPAAGLPADEGFVYLDVFPGTAERLIEHGRHFLHGLADAVAEEPSGFHGAAKGAVKLPGAMPFLLLHMR